MVAPGRVRYEKFHCIANSMMQNITIGMWYTDGPDCKTMIGAVDYSWLFTYALFMFVRYIIIVSYIISLGMGSCSTPALRNLTWGTVASG